MDFLDSSSPQPRPDDAPVELEIDTARTRRWRGLAGYAILFLAVCAALIFVFVQFTASVGVAIGLVVFMVSYMTLMGWLASRKADRRE